MTIMEDCNQTCPFTRFTRDLLALTSLNQPIYHLQHQSGFNINIILYVLWLAKARHGRLSKRDVKMLQGQVMLWHQRVIAELKYTHALLTDHNDSFALEIKHALQDEIIKAHVIEQRMLYESQIKTQVLRRTPLQQVADACASIMHYCELKNDLITDEDQVAFIQLFLAIFDGVKKHDIEKQLMQSFDRLRMNQPAQMMWEEF